MSDERKDRRKQRPDTRVSIPIICASCGKEEMLDYMPRGVPLTELKCAECMEELRGEDSLYAEVRRAKEEEQRRSWEIQCAECGETETLPFRPHADREYLCRSCFKGAEVDEEELAVERDAERAARREGRELVALGENVLKRKRRVVMIEQPSVGEDSHHARASGAPPPIEDEYDMTIEEEFDLSAIEGFELLDEEE